MNPHAHQQQNAPRPAPYRGSGAVPPRTPAPPPAVTYRVVPGPPPAYRQQAPGLPVTPGTPGGPGSPRRRRRFALILAIVAVLLIVAAFVVVLEITSRPSGGPSAFEQNTSTPLEDAADTCGISSVISDGGRTMTLQRVAAEESPGPVTYGQYDCVLTQLATPQSVRSHMGQTRALDGMQTNSWNDFEALWTYHPDSGINITITMIEA